MTDNETPQRRTVRYRGQVQGVGFRAAARRVAQRHDVAGYVRNMPDGSVSLVAEGTAAELERFLGALAERMREYIGDADIHPGPATGEFEGFEVRF